MEHLLGDFDCFRWKNHASDFIDGTLQEPLSTQAKNHLDSCGSCTEQLNHYLQVITVISSQKKVTLPPELRKAPLSATLPRVTPSKMTLTRWEKIPWYLRTSLETVAIVGVVLIGISVTPQLRTIYEKSIEKTLIEFKESLSIPVPAPEAVDMTLPPLQDKFPMATTGAEEEDELAGEDDTNVGESHVKVGKSQLWRFTLKTVSPDELRIQVVNALTHLKVPTNTPGLGGMQVPGGIEFKLILPQEMVLDLKHTLQKLVPNAEDNANVAPGSENFTWYMVKSKKKIPDGKSQVVIWLSQPN